MVMTPWPSSRRAEGQASADKPTLICCKTIIGKGSPNKEGTHDVHGAALGNAEIEATRKHLGWNHEPFVIPQDVYEGWDAKTKGEGLEKLWNNKFAEYSAQFPELAAEFTRRMKGELPADWAIASPRPWPPPWRRPRPSPPARPANWPSSAWFPPCPSASAVPPT
jgi:transketolase